MSISNNTKKIIKYIVFITWTFISGVFLDGYILTGNTGIVTIPTWILINLVAFTYFNRKYSEKNRLIMIMISHCIPALITLILFPFWLAAWWQGYDIRELASMVLAGIFIILLIITFPLFMFFVYKQPTPGRISPPGHYPDNNTRLHT